MHFRNIDKELVATQTLYQAGHFQQCANMLRKILDLRESLDPKAVVRIESLLALAYFKLGRIEQAIKVIASVNPIYRDIYHYMYAAEIYRNAGRIEDAYTAVMKAVGIDHRNAEAQRLAGAVLHQRGNYFDAERAFKKALMLKPGDADTYSNLGNTLSKLDKADEAKAAFTRATFLKPDFEIAWTNWGGHELREGNYDEAINLYKKALEINSGNPQANLGVGFAALTFGDFENGFRLYEWRFSAGTSERPTGWPRFDPYCQDTANQPEGKRLILLSEQGFGDTFMMLRFLPQLRDMGYEITVLCHKSLHSLIALNFPYVKFAGDEVDVKNHDVYCNMMGLPYALKLRKSSIPREPYLSAGFACADTTHGAVGFCWRGNPDHENDRHRSIRKDDFMRLFDGMDLRLINFTHGDERVSFRDWHETATVLTGLRLLVTVDTAVAHLAGAMGIPVWLLLPYVPDWRWMHHDEAGYNSPWYPTMLLYRQPRKGDWQSVFDYVLRSLKYKEIYR